MKKRKVIIIILVLALMSVSLCACTEQKRDSKEQNEILLLNMRISTFEATDDLINSNQCMIDLFYTEDYKVAIEKSTEALNLLIDAKNKMKDVISSHNFIIEEMERLQKNYERTVEIIKKMPNTSIEEVNELKNLMVEAANIHIYLLKCSQCFANLYCIRTFDRLSDENATEKLKETWWEFGFEDSVKCPDTVNKQELYIIWAKQFSENEPDKITINKIEELRKNDNLTSKNYNTKWLELIKEICSTNS